MGCGCNGGSNLIQMGGGQARGGSKSRKHSHRHRKVERVKCADMGENVVAVVPVDANTQRALVALENDSAALKNVADVDASAK